MLIADAQVHIWGPDTPDRPWRSGQPVHRETPLGADELLREMDAAGVARAVLVPPYWDAERDDVVMAAVRAHPERFSAMGRPDTETPGPPVPIATWCGKAGVRALRCSFNRPRQAATLMEGHMDWLWRDAERAGVPVMVLAPHSLMPVIDRIAEQHPGLRLSLCHLGLTSHEYDDVAFRDLDQLLALAQRPNVCVNASALPVYTRDSYPYRRLHPYLRRIFDAFGPQRMFWGTDYSRLPCSYREAVTMFTEEIPWLSTDDKERIMGRGLCEWLNWPLPS
ncbi:MAG TPA: amidohydrolase family protein [Burkholderiales bacterium]|nr:amidohydrolase family protein [Burkholderiales bacterium]